MNKEESDLIIAEQNKSTEEILKAVAKVKSDYKELCNLKDMRIAKLGEENKVLAQNLEDTEILNKTYEKRFKDLEKENAELSKNIGNLKKTYRKQRNKRIDDLQKENAELKKQLEMSNKVYNDNLDYSHHIEEQLTNAKELLKQWVELYKPKLEGYPITPIQEQTEQFLNSEVEK